MTRFELSGVEVLSDYPNRRTSWRASNEVRIVERLGAKGFDRFWFLVDYMGTLRESAPIGWGHITIMVIGERQRRRARCLVVPRAFALNPGYSFQAKLCFRIQTTQSTDRYMMNVVYLPDGLMDKWLAAAGGRYPSGRVMAFVMVILLWCGWLWFTYDRRDFCLSLCCDWPIDIGLQMRDDDRVQWHSYTYYLPSKVPARNPLNHNQIVFQRLWSTVTCMANINSNSLFRSRFARI